MTEEDVPNTSFLKSVVIILGILIIGVATMIGVTIYKRATGSEEVAEKSNISVPLIGNSLSVFGTANVKVPSGLDILSVDYDSGLMMVTYGEEEEPSVIAVVSLATGQQLGLINLRP